MKFYGNKNTIKFLIVLFLSCTYLIFLFKPYYFVTFDSEPDYLANALHIIKWGIPWGGHHPGTVMQYVYSGILRTTIFLDLDLRTTIIFLRIIYFLIFLVIIYLSSRFTINYNKKFFNYIISLSLIFPLINFHFSHFGVELILFALCVFLWTLFYRQIYFAKSSNNFLLISFLLGLTVSVKFSSIILVPIYFLIILFFIDENLKNKIYLILKSSFLSFITFIIFTIPSIRYYPKLFNKIKRQINFDTFTQNEIIFLLIIIFSFFLIFILIYFFYHSKIINYINKKKNMLISIFILIISILILKTVFENYTQNGILYFYFSIPSLLRNFIPILPIYLIILYHKKINLNFYVIVFFSIVNIFLCYSYFYNNKIYVDDLIFDNTEKKIVAFTSTPFSSKYFFLEFTKIRWGNNKLNYPNNWQDNVNFSLLLNDTYKSWFSKNVADSKQNTLIKRKDNYKKYDINFLNLIRNLSKSSNYGNEKFKKISLVKPTYNSRIIFDHCNYFVKSKVLFDLNYTDKKNVVFFESTIAEVEKFCKVNFLNKVIKNNIIIYEYK